MTGQKDHWQLILSNEPWHSFTVASNTSHAHFSKGLQIGLSQLHGMCLKPFDR